MTSQEGLWKVFNSCVLLVIKVIYAERLSVSIENRRETLDSHTPVFVFSPGKSINPHNGNLAVTEMKRELEDERKDFSPKKRPKLEASVFHTEPTLSFNPETEILGPNLNSESQEFELVSKVPYVLCKGKYKSLRKTEVKKESFEALVLEKEEEFLDVKKTAKKMNYFIAAFQGDGI